MHLSTRQTRVLHSLFHQSSSDEPLDGLDAFMVDHLARLFRADVVSVFALRAPHQAMEHNQSFGIEPALLNEYLDRLQSLSPFRPEFSRRAVVLASDVVQTARLLRTEFYEAFLGKAGICFGLNIRVSCWRGNPAEIRVWRSARHGDFDSGDVELAKLLRVMIVPLVNSRVPAATIRVPFASRDGNGGGPAAAACGEATLTTRERGVVECLLAGASDKEIARRLGIELCTVRTHLRRVFVKHGVRSRGQLVAKVGGRGS